MLVGIGSCSANPLAICGALLSYLYTPIEVRVCMAFFCEGSAFVEAYAYTHLKPQNIDLCLFLRTSKSTGQAVLVSPYLLLSIRQHASVFAKASI